jgi:hypothetical protein
VDLFFADREPVGLVGAKLPMELPKGNGRAPVALGQRRSRDAVRNHGGRRDEAREGPDLVLTGLPRRHRGVIEGGDADRPVPADEPGNARSFHRCDEAARDPDGGQPAQEQNGDDEDPRTPSEIGPAAEWSEALR